MRPPRRRTRLAAVALAAIAAAMLPGRSAVAQSPDIVLLSQTPHGFAAEGKSNTPAVNLNGLVTAYSSNAIDLVSPALQNSSNQVYLRPLDQPLSALISQAPGGQPGNGPSQDNAIAPGISDDGSTIAFSSLASNLVPAAANGKQQIFVASGGTLEWISRGTDDQPGNGNSTNPKLSGDGRFVVFQSTATNLVAQDTHGVSQIFFFDRLLRTLFVVSVGADQTVGDRDSITPTISEDGSTVAFASSATTLVKQSIPPGVNQIFVHELGGDGITELASVNDNGTPGNEISYFPALTRDGTQVAFKSEAFNLVPSDTNGVPDVFVRNRTEGKTIRVSVDSFGNQANNLSGGPAISADGRFVAFPSFANNLVEDDGDGQGDVFVYDRDAPVIKIKGVTVGKNLQPDNGVSDAPVTISADGRWIGFSDSASNLVPSNVANDFNNAPDAFLACNPFDEFNCAPPTATPTSTGPPMPPTPTDTPTPSPTPGARPCIGDCNGDGVVMVNELVAMVNIALELSPLCGPSGCLAGDATCDCSITVDEIIRAVNNALQGCHDYGSCTLDQEEQKCCVGTPTAGLPTATPSAPTATAGVQTPSPTGPTATATAVGAQVCVGDCDGNGSVTVDDLVRMVNVALELAPICSPSGCLAGDSDCNCQITVDEIIQAVNNLLNGCTTFNHCVDHQAMCCE